MGDSSDARPGTEGLSDTDQRYLELLRRVAAAGGEPLMLELDSVVGERMINAEDGVVLRGAAAAGVVALDVAVLRAELRELRQDLSTEVRTRRLVVVGPDGFERITADAGADVGSLRVQSPRGLHVALVADEQSGDGTAQLYLSGGGNGAGSFAVTEDGVPVVDAEGNRSIEPDSLYYAAELAVLASADERFHDVCLNREGLHFGG